jgi:GNAT superfamily N-acetyltransferase
MEFFEKTQKDNKAVSDIIKGWGSDFLVTRGKTYKSEDLEGILVYEKEKITGLGLYKIKRNCEIVLLETFVQNNGIGTKIIERIKEIKKKKKCKKVWLITTNSNINALGLYQKRGLNISKIYKNAMIKSRKIKPAIPKMENGIEIRDEIKFEIKI